MLRFVRPPPTGDERSTLQAFLNQQRAVLPWKLEGLDEEQTRRSMIPSGTSLLGLVKHLAWVEGWWFVDVIGGSTVDYPWTDEDPDADFRIEDDESITSITELSVAAVGEANGVIDRAESLEVTGRVRGERRSLRWVMVHMIEETARHAGHADILRERIDGATGYLAPKR